ncbi:sigma-54-dependent Fis family transcriptional regulator [candidate division KSB3 bacterium]|uniref:Sigma-54-dependent Fis family transcriptional regulator n=1 Tax=candidate division KSB3 bacterium TaxID=2044937 RepID=A0A2G6KD44_9BACT|nr:MAG: sigma-54-dependent Fis family transcriptional regulator [candidate division KSB3 bacterium]
MNTMTTSILIIDDNVKWCKSLAQNFEPRGYQVSFTTSGAEALTYLADHPVQVILLDIMLGKENGLALLEEILLQHHQIPVIMITGFGSIDTAVQSLKLGAFDYMTKPLDIEELLRKIDLAASPNRHALLTDQSTRPNKHRTAQLITQNERMLELCQKAKKFAETDFPVFITGENGTGKEVIADFIHAHSSRASQGMLKINCAAFPETLLDNELFGHEKGAYTGADTSFKGVFERADRSSLFLDEIGDMPLTIQAKILRTLQSHEIRRLGGHKTITVDVRFIAASNKNIRKLLRENTFREDLFYRLDVATIHMPPLRERKEDIPLLARYFLAVYADMHATPPCELQEDVLKMFLQHTWPGNIRELKNTIHYAATLSTTGFISCHDLPPRFKQIEHHRGASNIREDMERNLILSTLKKTRYNKKKTAELLNMSRTTLYKKLERYGLSQTT